MGKRRKPVTIWREWGLKGPLRSQLAVAKEAADRKLTRRDGDKVRDLAHRTRSL